MIPSYYTLHIREHNSYLFKHVRVSGQNASVVHILLYARDSKPGTGLFHVPFVVRIYKTKSS